MWIQNFNRGVHLFGLLILLASCSTLKNLSFPLKTGKQVTVVSDTKKSPRSMEFLEDISVTPGKITINNASNAIELFHKSNVDGGLIGGASLDWSAFQTICDSV